MDSEQHGSRAQRYFRLALKYAISGSEPRVLVVMGRVGTGKTTIARQLGRELDWPVFSSDKIRKTLAGLPLRKRTPPERRHELYSQAVTERTYRKLLEEGLAALPTNGGVILDATFSSRTNRQLLREQCKDIFLQVVELDVDSGEIESRLRRR